MGCIGFNEENLFKLPETELLKRLWWPISESNQGHNDFQSFALPTELIGHIILKCSILLQKSSCSKNVVKKVFRNFLKFISNLLKIPILRGFRWWPISESNQGHSDFQSLALPTELIGHK